MFVICCVFSVLLLVVCWRRACLLFVVGGVGCVSLLVLSCAVRCRRCSWSLLSLCCCWLLVVGVVLWTEFAAFCCCCGCSLLLFVVGDAVVGVGCCRSLFIFPGVDCLVLLLAIVRCFVNRVVWLCVVGCVLLVLFVCRR